MRRFGYDPLSLLVLHAQGKEKATRENIEIAKELLPYAYPRLRSVDATVAATHAIKVVIGGDE